MFVKGSTLFASNFTYELMHDRPLPRGPPLAGGSLVPIMFITLVFGIVLGLVVVHHGGRCCTTAALMWCWDASVPPCIHATAGGNGYLPSHAEVEHASTDILHSDLRYSACTAHVHA